MAATPQQGTYLGTTLLGFTSIVAGVVVSQSHSAIGLLSGLVGLTLLVCTGIGLHRIKG